MDKPQIEIIKQEAEKAREEERKRRMIKYPAYNHKTGKMETREKIGKAGKGAYKRIVILATMILLEVIVFAFMITQFITEFLWVLAVFNTIGIIFSIRVAVSNSKNYDSKIAWIMFLLIISPVAIFAYLLAGEMTTTPIKSRRLKRIDERTKLLDKREIQDTLPPRVQQDCRFIQNTSDYAVYYNGSCEYFPNGEDFFEDVLNKLKTAKQFVFMDFFILDEGQLANAIFTILIDKAKSGVDVRIVVDGLGSHGTISWRKVKRIRKHGIKIVTFSPLVPFANLLMNYRDHRKIVVVDGNIGYVGGANIADEYVNAKVKFGLWKDAALRIEGEAVRSLTLTFLRMWEYCTKEKPDYELFLNATISGTTKAQGVIVPYAGGPEQKYKLCKEVYGNILGNARETLHIMTPYFIVDRHMMDTLINKAQSGVDVRLIIPGTADQGLPYSQTLANAKSVIKAGVKVYLYTPGFLHSKVVFSDNECAVVGSVNMDFRSFYQQHENAAYISEPTALAAIAKDFKETFEASRELKQEDIKKSNVFVRVWLSFVRLFAPLM